MATIVPAILEATGEGVAQRLLHVKDFATETQIDIVDGSFASPATWPYQEGLMTQAGVLGLLPHSENLSIELDLMIDDPERSLVTWMGIGARRILLHLESTTQMKAILSHLRRDYGHDKGFMSDALAVGIALQQETKLELLEPYLDAIDYVQFMGIKRIGVQGQPFAPEVLNKIHIFRSKHPDMPVQVDGGVTLEVAPELLSLGVSRLIVGSGIWKTEHPARAFGQYQALVQQFGLYE